MINLRIYNNPYQPAIKEEIEEDRDVDDYDYDDDGYIYYESRKSVEGLNRKRITGEILERFKQASIIRYVEAWEGIYKINREYLSRALGGTSEFVKTMTGVFGAFNGKAFQKSGNEWKVVNLGKLYPQIKRLDQEGVNRIRAVFQENKQNS